MTWAFTITSNYKWYNGDKSMFEANMLRCIQFCMNYDVRELEYVIEHAPTMGYHAHGIFNRQVKKNLLNPDDSVISKSFMKSFYIYEVKLKDDDAVLNWRQYMNKTIYKPHMLLDE